MSNTKAKSKIYDSVFTDLFSDAEYQLRLYRDLHPEDTDVTADDITDVTLKPVLTDQIYNDLGFTVRNRTILLVEAQSTWSPNMSLRSMLYLANSYQDYIQKTNQRYYSKTKVKLPKPELYVIFTGDDSHHEEIQSMADIYWNGDDSVMDVKVKVIRGDEPDAILTEYAQFTRIYRKHAAQYGATAEALNKTIEECMEKGILADYLRERRGEVGDLADFLFDQDKITELYENSLREEGRKEGRKEGREEGRKEGRKEGERNKAVKVAHEMLACGEDITKVSQYTGLTEAEIAGL